MKVAVVASGDLEDEDVTALDGADLVIAADGGSETLARIGRRPHVLVGDLDSTSPELVDRLAASGTRVERHPPDKEASDTELALDAARSAGASSIVLLGAIGGERLDHAIGNVLLLADPAHGVVELRHRGAIGRVVRAGETLEVAGPIVSLLPIGGDATGVTTAGLRWALDDATLSMGGSRGLSNEVSLAPASVRLTGGTLLVVESPARGTAP